MTLKPLTPPPRPSTPVLKTKRLILRPPRPEDAEILTSLANDVRIAANTLYIPHPYRRVDAENFILASNQMRHEPTFLVGLEDGQVVGACGIGCREQPELGYWLAAPHWGQGYATEAARAVIDYAFGDLGHQGLQAGARVTNAASRRVLEKCGFQWTGVGLYRIEALASSAPIDRFRLDRGIWASLKDWGEMRQVA
jgi:RimJ/RimL family protein N-acetyltransferase